MSTHRHKTLDALDAAMKLFVIVRDEAPRTIAAITDSAPSVYGGSTAFAGDAEVRHADPTTNICETCRGIGKVRVGNYGATEGWETCAACGGRGEVPDTGPSTPTETAALSSAREQARHLARRYNRSLATIAAELTKMLSIGSKLNPVPVPRCNRGSGRDGVIEWGDPLCSNIAEADRGGLCSACAKREYRWRVAHGMPPRDRDAA